SGSLRRKGRLRVDLREGRTRRIGPLKHGWLRAVERHLQVEVLRPVRDVENACPGDAGEAAALRIAEIEIRDAEDQPRPGGLGEPEAAHQVEAVLDQLANEAVDLQDAPREELVDLIGSAPRTVFGGVQL